MPTSSLFRRNLEVTETGLITIQNPCSEDYRGNAGKLPLYIDQGARFYRRFQWLISNTAEDPHPLVGPILSSVHGYKWTAVNLSTHPGEYYVEASAGGDPGLSALQTGAFPNPVYLSVAGAMATWRTTSASGAAYAALITGGELLATPEWTWMLDPTDTYNTIYVRLADSLDPDTKYYGYVRGPDDTYYDISMQIRATKESSTIIKTLTIGSGIELIADDSDGEFLGGTGKFAIDLLASDTTLLDFSQAYYDLEIYPTNDSDSLTRLIEGKVYLNKNVTI